MGSKPSAVGPRVACMQATFIYNFQMGGGEARGQAFVHLLSEGGHV